MIRITLRLALVLLISLLLGRLTARAQEFATLPAGTPVEDEVTDRLGDEWVFSGCAGASVTLTMETEGFAPLLQLYGPADRAPLLEVSAAGNATTAAIEAFTLPTSGEFVVVAAGKSFLARGPYSLTMVNDQSGAAAELGDALLAYGAEVADTVTDRIGDEWFFQGCTGDVVTVAMQSEDFAPHLELIGPSARLPLAEEDGATGAAGAVIEELVLPESGLYLLAAAGRTIRDRGAYTLSLTLVDQTTPTPTPLPTATRTKAPTSTPTPAGMVCIVAAPALNLRSGPGSVYAPPIGSLARSDRVRPIGRDSNTEWIEIEVVASGRTGWVSAATRYITCPGDLTTLPLGTIPPTPRPTNTPLPTATFTPGPTSTPAPPSQANNPLEPVGVVIQGPGLGVINELIGDVYTFENYGQTDSPIFRDRFAIELFVWDPKRGDKDGDGIDRVEISITLRGDEVYSHTERTPRFCSFGGGEPECTVIRLRPGAKWPDSDRLIEASSDYRIAMTVFPKRSGVDPSFWGFPFELDFDDGGGGQTGNSGNQQELVVELAQAGPGTTSDTVFGELVFQVEASDPGRGGSDGDGIAEVEHEIFGPDGNRVYARTEGSPHYCAFSGGEPDCDVFRFTPGDSNWEGTDNQVQTGLHTLRATVRAEDGRTVTREWQIQIQ